MRVYYCKNCRKILTQWYRDYISVVGEVSIMECDGKDVLPVFTDNSTRVSLDVEDGICPRSDRHITTPLEMSPEELEDRLQEEEAERSFRMDARQFFDSEDDSSSLEEDVDDFISREDDEDLF